MTIDKSDARLTAYAFDELDDREKAEFEAELGESESAQRELDEIQQTLSALRSEFAETAPPTLEARRRLEVEGTAEAKVAKAARTRRRRRVLGVLASVTGVAASVALFTMAGVRNEPVPFMPPAAVVTEPVATATVGVLEAPPVPADPGRGVDGTGLRHAPSLVAPGPSPPRAVHRPSSGLTTPGFGGPSSDVKPRELGMVARSEPQPYSTMPTPTGVKAGEWDDNANYREFQRWLGTRPALAHWIDIRDRHFIVVRDAAGLGVPACRVVIEDDAQRQTELVTTASGRAILFPHAEGLSGQTLTASTNCGGGAQRRFALNQVDGVVDLRLRSQRALGTRTIDVAFILDSTGSMHEEIAAVKATIQTVASSLRNSDVRIRVGLVEFKDRSDEYVTRVFPMSTELSLFSQQVAAVSASGGGDDPESVNEALHVGVQQLGWNDDAFAKLAFLVGDAPPHLDYSQDYDYALEAREAAHRGIQLFTVAASGMDTLGQVVWRQVAAYTGATNLFVLRGGAGPQSTGGGDPKASCGGTQTAYTTGNLDALVLAKINGAIRALDRDPMRIAGLHADENSKPCAERLVIAQ